MPVWSTMNFLCVAVVLFPAVLAQLAPDIRTKITVGSLSRWCPKVEHRRVSCLQAGPTPTDGSPVIYQRTWKWKKHITMQCCPGYDGEDCTQAEPRPSAPTHQVAQLVMRVSVLRVDLD
ncbi:hypothetical protein BsWGS_21495 [Bradybaena similaris]